MLPSCNLAAYAFLTLQPEIAPSQEIQNIAIQTITSMACSAEVDAVIEKSIAATNICTLPLADTSNFVSYSELTNTKFRNLYDTAKFSSKFKSAFPLANNVYRLLLTAPVTVAKNER